MRGRLEAECGFVFPDSQLPILEAKLNRILPSLGVDVTDNIQHLLNGNHNGIWTKLVSALTVGETYFMRNQAQFEALRSLVLPGMIHTIPPGSPLVFWSAGCASGEEAYSIAMCVKKYAPAFWPNRVRIIATDINPNFLTRAKLGRYSNWSLRHLETRWRQDFFTQDRDKHWIIDNQLTQTVQFRHHNLVSSKLPDHIEKNSVAVIFCRNVFIYLSPGAIQKVLDLFASALQTGGILFLGHAESFVATQNWQADYHHGTFFFRYQENRTSDTNFNNKLQSEKLGTTNLSYPTHHPEPLQSKRPPWPKSPASSLPNHTPPVQITIDALLHQARIFINQGRLEDADNCLKILLRQDKVSTEGYFLSALVYDQRKDWSSARHALKNAIFLDKRLVLGHYLLATLDEREGAIASALKRYHTIKKLLGELDDRSPLPLGDGLTAGRLRELIAMRITELSVPI